MAYRGEFEHGDRAGTLRWEVVQYKMVSSDRFYVRGATPSKLDSSDIEWVRLRVDSINNPGEYKYVQLWGPYLRRDVIEGELAAAFDRDDYLEAIGV